MHFNRQNAAHLFRCHKGRIHPIFNSALLLMDLLSHRQKASESTCLLQLNYWFFFFLNIYIHICFILTKNHHQTEYFHNWCCLFTGWSFHVGREAAAKSMMKPQQNTKHISWFPQAPSLPQLQKILADNSKQKYWQQRHCLLFLVTQAMSKAIHSLWIHENLATFEEDISLCNLIIS